MTVKLTSNFLKNSRGFTLKDGGGIIWTISASTNEISANGSGAGASGANPSAKVGLTAVNGSAATFMRSDGAPPVDQTIAPTWTGAHTFAPTAGVAVTVNAPTGANAVVVNSTAVGNGAVIKLVNQATTGTQTASFSATNKPGASSGTPQKWLMINLDGTQYYIPCFS